MAGENGKVARGMSVLTSDGVQLGTVADVWIGTDPTTGGERCDEQVLVASVLLKVDEVEATRLGWTHRPAWLGAD